MRARINPSIFVDPPGSVVHEPSFRSRVCKQTCYYDYESYNTSKTLPRFMTEHARAWMFSSEWKRVTLSSGLFTGKVGNVGPFGERNL